VRDMEETQLGSSTIQRSTNFFYVQLVFLTMRDYITYYYFV
jgi:hypothetical protein